MSGDGSGEALSLPSADAAASSAAAVLAQMRTAAAGLDDAEVVRRRAAAGPNAVRTHHAQPLRVLARQFGNAVLILLAVTAVIAYALGDRTDAVVILLILVASVGLGFVNEYRAERATDALHSQVRHEVVAVRAGTPRRVEVTELVPGDVVRLSLGEVVPADLRLLDTTGLQCDESVLTGESLPADKSPDAVPAGSAVADRTSCAFMGTVVRAGSGTGVVIATGAQAEFGKIAAGLGDRQPETEFQAGLRRFSFLLLQVALTLTTLIFVANVLLRRPVLDSVLFSLAIAVGITPQLLPAVVSTSLAAGSRRLAARKVLVKRLVCIEDLGDLDVLVTDKTGTLTDGHVVLRASLDPSGVDDDAVLRLGLLATEVDLAEGPAGAVVGNPLDAALWAARGGRAPMPAELVAGYTRIGLLPFDHERQLTSAVVRGPDGATALIVKGAPEQVLARCTGAHEGVSAAAAKTAQATLDGLFAAGQRVVAVATRPAGALVTPTPADEKDLLLSGFVVLADPPKASAAASLRRLHELGIAVKVCTGDNPVVAEKICTDLGLPAGGTLTGAEITDMDDAALTAAAQTATVFARVSPEQKARLVRLLRGRGRAIGFLGDGVNDALALHAADVGISVDTATDVAKDAADVVLLEKDLAVLADGVVEGRRIFANTIKYVLMGTSSNFGNMFSAAAASAVLPFLPMLPSQILLNNLLYDAGQLTIPTDRVDEEQLHAPSHWDVSMIRRFMLFFGPISSVIDFVTFALMIGVFRAGAPLFRGGWFAESLATQTLVIFVIRTRRSPFTRSRPSRPLLVAALSTVVVGVALPESPLAGVLGFHHFSATFLLALVGLVVAYLALAEGGKRIFFAEPDHHAAPVRRRGRQHRIERRAARFSTGRSVSPGNG